MQSKKIPMQLTNISEVKASLSRLIKSVQETGKPVIIGKAGEPVAVLSAYRRETAPRKLGGSWEGKVSYSANPDEANEEISESFYNTSIFPEKSGISF